MKFYGIEIHDDFNPSTSKYHEMIERNIIQTIISSLYFNGRQYGTFPGYSWLEMTDFVVDTHFNSGGRFNKIDKSTSTAVYEATNKERFYDSGDIIQTNNLYDQSMPITRVVVDEISNNPPAFLNSTKVQVSLDDGSTWTATNDLGIITDFTGTSNGGGNYRLKLKFSRTSGIYYWTVTGNMNRPRGDLAGCGTFLDSLSIGGHYNDAYLSIAESDFTEKWNGSTWAVTSAINVARATLAACGTTLAALCFGGGDDAGSTYDDTEKWNGSVWATTGNMTQARHSVAGCGTTAAALNFGGGTLGINPYQNTTEKWNGSAWATTTDMTQTKKYTSGCGITSDALNFGGQSSTTVSTTEIWNGSSWATTTNLNATHTQAAGIGTTSSAMSFGGGYTTEIWDGSSWSTASQPTLSFTRWILAGAGTTAGALAFGGSSYNYFSTTEKYTLGSQLGFGVKIN